MRKCCGSGSGTSKRQKSYKTAQASCRWTGIGGLVLLLSMLSACANSNLQPPPDFFSGIWKSDSHGFYLEISEGIVNRYQYTSISCFSAPAGYLPQVSYITGNTINNWASIGRIDARHFWIQRPQDSTVVTLTRIPEIPQECFIEPIDSALMKVLILWQSIYENFAGFSRVDVSWDTLKDRYIRRAIDLDLKIFAAEEEFDLRVFELLEELVRHLQDDHAFIMAPSLERVSFPSTFNSNLNFDSYEEPVQIIDYLTFIETEYLDSQLNAIANKKIHYGLTRGKNLYWNIQGLGNFSGKDSYGSASRGALLRVLKKISKVTDVDTKIVLDLRFNSGGSIAFANLIASCLYPNIGTVTFLEARQSNPDNTSFTNKQAAGYGIECPKHIKHKNVYVLTSRYTASAAEYLALNLKAGGAVLAGETTRGIFSPSLLRSLPGNWYFSISNQELTTAQGLRLEGIGVIPDIAIEVDFKTNLSTRHDRLLHEFLGASGRI